MKEVNFSTDQIVLLCYPGYAGGNFVINCLSLSNIVNSYSTDNEYVINNNKNELLDNWITSISKQSLAEEWVDFLAEKDSTSSATKNTYGILSPISTVSIDTMSPEIFPSYLFGAELNKLSNDHTHKFIVGLHHQIQVDKVLKFWPNAKVIIFDSYRKFLKFRKRDCIFTIILQPHWTDIRGENWPIVAPFDLDDFLTYPSNVQSEVSEKFPEFFYKLTEVTRGRLGYYDDYDQTVEKYRSNNSVIFFNTDTLLSNDTAILQLTQLYQQLELTDFNEQTITLFYNTWFNKIKEISEYK